jgi:thioredoxin-like negative regulator of GroEL
MARVFLLAIVVFAVQTLGIEWNELSHIKPIDKDNYVAEVVNSKLPYVLTFVDRKGKDSKSTYEEYNSLAEKMNGKFNFGMINKIDSEHLMHAFENRYFPSTYLLVDGTAFKYSDSLTAERLERFILNEPRYTEAGI